MKYKVALSILLIIVSAGLLWSEEFWSNYSEKDREVLGEAYWLAGVQYAAVGKTEKANAFKAVAKRMYPQIDPSQIKEVVLPSAAELLAQGKTTIIASDTEAVPVQALDSFFLRFVGSLLDENSAEAAGFLDGQVYFSKGPGDLSRAQAQVQLDTLFAQVSMEGLTHSSLYNLDTIVTDTAPQQWRDKVGEAYVLRVDAKADFSSIVPFWEARQQFFIRKQPTGYTIFAIGSSAPPLSWSPSAAGVAPAVAAQAAPAAASDSEVSKQIIDAFTGSLSAFLKKNVDGSIAFMAQQVLVQRLGQTLTKDELRTTFMGYFETADFGTAEFSDVYEVDSMFVESSQSPVSSVGESVYLLNVQAKRDLSATVPIWTTYQKWYFLQDAGGWKIFAIF